MYRIQAVRDTEQNYSYPVIKPDVLYVNIRSKVKYDIWFSLDNCVVW